MTAYNECRTLVVLDGEERKCLIKGDHTVHKYIDGDGVPHLFEIVPYLPDRHPVL